MKIALTAKYASRQRTGRFTRIRAKLAEAAMRRLAYPHVHVVSLEMDVLPIESMLEELEIRLRPQYCGAIDAEDSALDDDGLPRVQALPWVVITKWLFFCCNPCDRCESCEPIDDHLCWFEEVIPL